MSARLQPEQRQSRQPGREREMRPQPDYEPKYPGVGKLEDRVALITGGDSGIGRATAVAMAREGAKIAIVYLEEDQDADETLRLVEREGSRAIKITGDVGKEEFCTQAVERTVKEFGRLDILVNNAAEQHETKDPLKIDAGELERTFRTNLFGYFFMVKAVLPHLNQGAVILNSTSITAYKGHETLLSYAATKGAIVSGVVRSQARRQARRRDADGAQRPAQRGGAVLRVLGERGCFLHQRPGASPEWRHRSGIIGLLPPLRNRITKVCPCPR